MKTRRSLTLPDDRTISVHMTSGAVIRLRPSELVGWVVGDLKPKRRNQIELANEIKAAPFQIMDATPRSVNLTHRLSPAAVSLTQRR